MEVLMNLNFESYDTFRTVLEEIIQSLHKSEQIPLAGDESKFIVNAKDEIRKLITTCNYDWFRGTEII
ncbi:hypothetical protein evm_009234 [Chilo suppressalis]|nr:hypothetical protein evm_009234 [Chilo suppressalis]